MSGTNREKWLTGILLLITAGLYLISIHSPFLYDDVDQILLNPLMQHLGNVLNPFAGDIRQSRLLMNLSFWLNWQISSSTTWSYHLFNILLHLGNGLLLRAFLKRIFPEQPLIALFTLALFLLHPLQSESVAYIMGRISLLECMLTLLAMNLCFGGDRHKWKLAWLLFLSPLVKETALLLPFLMLSCHLIENHENTVCKLLIKRWYYFLPWLSAPVWFYLCSLNRNYNAVVGFHLFPVGQYFLTQMYYFLFRILLLISPARQSFIHEYPLFSTAMGLVGAASLLLILGSTFVSWKTKKSNPRPLFLITFLILTVAPSGSLLQLVNPFAEYRLYLSNIVFFVAMSWLLCWFIRKLRAGIKAVVLIAVLSFFAFFTFQQNLLWADPIQLIEQSIENYPHSYRLFSMLGSVQEERGQYEEAEKSFLESDHLNDLYAFPKTLRPKILLVQLYERQGLWEKARTQIESIPVRGFRRPPREYYLHYLKILSALNDSTQFRQVLHEGLQYYPDLS